MKQLIKMSAAAALVVMSKSGVDPEDMSDEELEAAFNEAKSQENIEEDVGDTEQPDAEDNTEDTSANVDSDDEDSTKVDGDEDEDSKEEPTAVEANAQTDAGNDKEQTETEEQNVSYEDEYIKVVDGQTEFKPLKINGEEIPIKSMQELYTLGSKGGHFTQSMQEIAPYRRSISAMKENGLTEADINLLIEAKGGSKDALSAIMQNAGVDPLDVEEKPADAYEPKQYGQNDQQMQIQDIQKSIGSDPEFSITQNVIDQQWDAGSRSEMAKDPNMILGLHEDIKTGVYQEVAPEASKLAAMDGYKKSNLEYYMEAGQQYYAVKDAEAKRQENPEPQNQRQSNSKQKRSAGRPGGTSSKKPDVIDYLDMNDDDFDKQYDDIMSRV